MPEEVVVLEPGDDRAKLIARAMASQTASDILGVLKNGPFTSSEISEQLSIPITTVSYHIDNLVKADIIEVVRTRWSPKGREVKIYGLRDQVVIVAPGTMDIRSLLLKYASVFGIFIIASIMVAVIFPLISMPYQAGAPVGEGEDFGLLKAPAAEENLAPGERTSPEVIALQSMTVAFFTGGTLVIMMLLGYELYIHYRDRRIRDEKK